METSMDLNLISATNLALRIGTSFLNPVPQFSQFKSLEWGKANDNYYNNNEVTGMKSLSVSAAQ